MKKLSLFLTIIIMSIMLGCAGISEVAESEMRYTVNCPPADAYMQTSVGGVRLKEGEITRHYEGKTVSDIMAAEKAIIGEDIPWDNNACPPTNGALMTPFGSLPISPGFFDNNDNWMTSEEAGIVSPGKNDVDKPGAV